MQQNIVIGVLLDEAAELSLGELSRACMVHADWIIELVDEGILEPSGEDIAQWRFSGSSLTRALTVIRLQQDLDINLSGAALVLELLDEIDSLRSRLRIFEPQD
jgi:chaperone modulatory protein CbpM